MLYDQALVAAAALEASQATGDAFFATMAQEIFTFVMREMTSPDGGFYAGLDADSEGEEGKYYIWTPAEVREILGDKDAELFSRLFGELEVHPMRPQLDRQDKTRFDGQLPRMLRAGIPGPSQLSHRRYCREAFAKALHPAALVVDTARAHRLRFPRRLDHAGELLAPGKFSDALPLRLRRQRKSPH